MAVHINPIAFIFLIFIIIVLIRYLILPLFKTGNYTIFGSTSCPWTIKALDLAKKEGHDYKYVDCKKGKCPKFVNGFPTYKHHGSGNVSSGYTESPLLI